MYPRYRSLYEQFICICLWNSFMENQQQFTSTDHWSIFFKSLFYFSTTFSFLIIFHLLKYLLKFFFFITFYYFKLNYFLLMCLFLNNLAMDSSWWMLGIQRWPWQNWDSAGLSNKTGLHNSRTYTSYSITHGFH